MMTTEMEYVWDMMVELGVATDDEIGLACALCGTTMETLERVLYVRTGYRSLEQMLEEDEDED